MTNHHRKKQSADAAAELTTPTAEPTAANTANTAKAADLMKKRPSALRESSGVLNCFLFDLGWYSIITTNLSNHRIIE